MKLMIYLTIHTTIFIPLNDDGSPLAKSCIYCPTNLPIYRGLPN